MKCTFHAETINLLIGAFWFSQTEGGLHTQRTVAHVRQNAFVDGLFLLILFCGNYIATIEQ
jgi:hypothetical protein